MFLNNIFQFLKGYVIILVKGNSVGHFINVCMHRNIVLKSISCRDDGAVKASVSVSDFKKLRSVARKTHVRIHILEKKGLYRFIQKYRKRIFYILGMCVFLIMLIASKLFIWKIDVVGSENRDEIKKAAGYAGIRLGAYIPHLPEGDEIKGVILTNTERLTWAWVYFAGGKATIEVREGILPPKMIDKKTPCDIVALRDGIITDMTVKKGNPFCKRGDVVLTGDLLVGGTLTDEEGNFRLEHSLGEIYAHTVHKAKGQIRLYRAVREPTGKKKNYYNLNFFSKLIPLHGKINIPFSEYSIKKHELKLNDCIILDRYSYEEETVNRIPIPEEKAVEAVVYELEADIAENLLPGSVLKNKEISYTKIDEETIEVSLTMEFTEQIGTEVLLQRSEIIESD